MYIIVLTNPNDVMDKVKKHYQDILKVTDEQELRHDKGL